MFFLTIAFGLITLATINTVVNPLGYYPTRRYPALVWSSRRVKLDLLERAAPAVVVVLGSSRSMKLSTMQIGERSGLSAFNAAVDSARAEDWLALFRFVTDTMRWNPKELIIGIDIEAFHDHLEPDPRLLGESRLRPFLPFSMRVDGLGHILAALVSFDQTRHSITSLRMAFAHRTPTGETEFASDGGIARDGADLVDGGGPDSTPSLTEYENRFAGFQHLDERRWAMFEDLLAAADARAMVVRAFVTPLSDSVRVRLGKTRRLDLLHAELRAALDRARARHPSLQVVVDALDVRAVGGDPRAFYDGAHVRAENAERIVDALYRPGQSGDAVQ
jgi:hypothetical protein